VKSINRYTYKDEDSYLIKHHLLNIFKSNIKGISSLSSLHEHTLFNKRPSKKVTRENDQDNFFIKLYYDYYIQAMFPLYLEFIKNELIPIFGTDQLVCQTIPNLRIHAVGSIAVGEYHKDKWYRDEHWSSAVQEWNIFLPVTQARNTSTIWSETEEDRGDYQPLDANIDEFYIWDGANLMHGNKPNQETFTRVSFDFRVMLKENYVPLKKGSINTNSKFEIGDYYFDFGNLNK
jgi:hypothetical protein